MKTDFAYMKTDFAAWLYTENIYEYVWNFYKKMLMFWVYIHMSILWFHQNWVGNWEIYIGAIYVYIEQQGEITFFRWPISKCTLIVYPRVKNFVDKKLLNICQLNALVGHILYVPKYIQIRLLMINSDTSSSRGVTTCTKPSLVPSCRRTCKYVN
jgi:hypothetical protein